MVHASGQRPSCPPVRQGMIGGARRSRDLLRSTHLRSPRTCTIGLPSAARAFTTSRTSTSTSRATAWCHHGPLRVGQVVARLRHGLRRGAAPLRRVAVGLCAAVPRADGEAGRRPDRRAVARHRHRAEDDGHQPPLDGRHGHRNLRLPPPAVREPGHAPLPLVRPGDRVAVARAHPRSGACSIRRTSASTCSRPIVRGRKGEFKKELAALRAKGFTRARVDGQISIARGRDLARSAAQPHDRGARRSPDREAGPRAPAHRLDCHRPRARQRHPRHQHARRRRSPVLAAAGVHDLRRQHSRDVAARLLVQLAARRLSDAARGSAPPGISIRGASCPDESR